MRAAAVTLLCTAVALAATPEERAAALVSEMTIEEKITMLHGISSPHYTGLVRRGMCCGALHEGGYSLRCLCNPGLPAPPPSSTHPPLSDGADPAA